MSPSYESVWDDLDNVVAAWIGDDFLTSEDMRVLRRSLLWDHHVPTVDELLPLATALASLTTNDPETIAKHLHERFSGQQENRRADEPR